MLSIKFIRENTDLIKKDLEKRQDKEKLQWVDDIIQKDEQYRLLLVETQKLRHSRNAITKEINDLRKAGKDFKEKVEEAKELPTKIKEQEEIVEKLQKEIKFIQLRIPNILHESVPYGKNDEENQEVRKNGTITTPSFELQPHGELIEKQGLADFETAAKISGKGFYYLLGDLALMELALQQFAIDFLVKKGFTLVQPPFMMRREPYEGVTDLEDFESMMYKVEAEDEELYLIATSEHPIGAMLKDKVIEESKLPMKLAGLSACFRKEIGSHGIDERGLFRVHQFNKIEQFVFCTPEDSWKIHEELIHNAEQLFQKLKLPYRIVNICTGDIGIVAAKKYDLEVWMPREKKYKEAVSCSNCTDYQATRLNIKYQKDAEKPNIHTLNSTAIATGRCLRAIIENYQKEDGTIEVPKVLQQYMHGIKVLGKKQ
ncbi:MAG: serine--tRNA ligase [Nanoarchaeota archaeon]|nr:serine--tRNA ligase [Nanoarchaeota archaeon]